MTATTATGTTAGPGGLEPWVTGQMDHVIAITPQIITGIQLAG